MSTLPFVVLAVLLCACPAKTGAKRTAEPCTKFGQNCELSPGKLGTCIRRENCSEGDCYVCQSQH